MKTLLKILKWTGIILVVAVIANGMADLVQGDNGPAVQYIVTGGVLLLAAAIDAVDSAWPSSVLPSEPPAAAVAAADAWLREVRRRFW